MMHRSRTRAAVTGVLLTIGVLLANAAVSYWNTERLVENEHSVAHTLDVLKLLEDVRATMADAETGQRGFLITGNPKYLETYQDAQQESREQFANLNTLIVDNPEQQARAAKLQRHVASRFERLQYNIDLRQEDGFEAAQQVVGTDQGQQLMEQIRRTDAEMQAAENKLLTLRAAQSERSLQIKTITNIIGTLLGIAAVCLAFWFFQRTLTERRKAEQDARAQAIRQAAVSELRQRALSDSSLDVLMNWAARLAAEVLDVPLVKILELLPDGNAFLLRAGVGWKEGLVGNARVGAGLDSQAGFTLRSSKPCIVGDLTTHEPVIVSDLHTEPRFHGPSLLFDHGVVSGISVIIYDQPDHPFGVLGAHTTCRRSFSGDEAEFLHAIANVLAAAIQRRRAEDALRDSERHFRALADSVPEIVWTSLPDGRCDYVNQRWFDFTGMTLEDTKGFGWVSALHEGDVERSTDDWMHAMETGEPFECEYRFRAKDGAYRWCLGRALPLRDDQGHIIKWFGNCLDIDEHKHVEEVLKDADRRKDEFLAMLGHELRNPLTPITGAVEVLKLKSPDDPEIQWSAEVIVHQTEQIVRLVDDLLDVSRIVHGKVKLECEPVAVKTIVERAVEACRPLIDSKRHKLTVSLPQETIWLNADVIRLVQVLENLLVNAARYTTEGGRIWLTVQRDGEEAVLRVRDNGIGIDADMLPRIFELFSQAETVTAQHQGGLGLGLKLVSALVEMHGGSVQALSDGPGTGSEFVVRLPALTQTHDHAAPKAPTRQAGRPAKSQRILIVDDQQAIVDSLAHVLRTKGHEVQTATAGETALKQVREFHPSVVLADIGLPGMDGFELATRLRAEPECCGAFLVALTGFAQEDLRRRVREAGFDQFILKPPDLSELDSLLASADVKPSSVSSLEGRRVTRH
jgi:PAS domain S-box-containing protein